MSGYEQAIREAMARAGRVAAADPRWVEAWMRLEHGCLDGLSAAQFQKETTIALECIAASAASENESLAESFGL
jgi:hypothetical protein